MVGQIFNNRTKRQNNQCLQNKWWRKHPWRRRRKPIGDAVNTLICSISHHFIGGPSNLKDKNLELLSNLKCRDLGNFWEYKDIFLTRVLLRTDYNQPFWKEKFLAGLPFHFGEQIRNKIREEYNDQIPYQNLSYGEIISYIQKQWMQMCTAKRLQAQLKKEQKLTNRTLASFCSQYDPSYQENKIKNSCKENCQNKSFYKPKKPFRKTQQSTNQNINKKPTIKTQT